MMVFGHLSPLSPMNSKDKNGKPPATKKVMPLMTPRNLVPATPMRFSGSAAVAPSVSGQRVIKGPQKSGKEESSIPLPPGYVDRAAQRRSGLETTTTSTLNIFENERVTSTSANSSSDPMKNKLEFLKETSGIEGFPACYQIQTERLMKHVLGVGVGSADGESVNKIHVTDFKDKEAFLQFKSIEESKTQPFDPFNRPRKVFRAVSGLKEKTLEPEDDFVLERVKEAVKRLEIASERHQKYFEALNQKSEKIEIVSHDIFPEVGIFDEKAALEEVINNNKTEVGIVSGKVKAKNRLFSSKSEPKTAEKEVDVFELIAQKSLGEEKNKKLFEEEDCGGLFGFSSILPKLSRLESEINSKGNENNKLTGVYASILSDDEEGKKEKDEDGRSTRIKAEDDADDDYLYPGYLENDPTIFDSDEDIIENDGKMPKNKRKLARKEDKKVAKVEKLVKNKFGVDLSK